MDSNYIRTERIKKNNTKYCGTDITINLSKPEKTTNNSNREINV